MRRPTLSLNEVIFQTLISQFNYLKRLMMDILEETERTRDSSERRKRERHLKGVVIHQREAETTSSVVLPPA
jgi:hypothetical protein